MSAIGTKDGDVSSVNSSDVSSVHTSDLSGGSGDEAEDAARPTKKRKVLKKKPTSDRPLELSKVRGTVLRPRTLPCTHASTVTNASFRASAARCCPGAATTRFNCVHVPTRSFHWLAHSRSLAVLSCTSPRSSFARFLARHAGSNMGGHQTDSSASLHCRTTHERCGRVLCLCRRS